MAQISQKTEKISSSVKSVPSVAKLGSPHMAYNIKLSGTTRLMSQLINELISIGIKIGLLINFGRERVEFKRLVQ